MELVYLWVEEYKNIYHQGFNFSPRFECNYDEDTKKLTIEKKDYVSIFPDNINITAIVGENGSGKSTILNSLTASTKGLMWIYKIENMFYYFQTKINHKIEYPDKFEELQSPVKLIEIVKLDSDFFSQEFITDDESYRTAKFKWSVYNILNPIFDDKYQIIKLVEYEKLIKDIIIKYGSKVNSTLFNFYPKDEKEYKELSHGERQAYSTMLLLYDKIINTEKKYFEILLDEIEITLHPKWQKVLLNELIRLCSSITNKKIHFVLASHSPFILSDLPKENIIFLKDGKQEYPFKDKQTFGANIHTLLSDGFFMSDGLMGEFAKSKINEVIELLKKEKLKDSEIKKCQDIISIIGEPLLQNTLKQQLDIKLHPQETELQKLEREQLELQEKIKAIKESESSETD